MQTPGQSPSGPARSSASTIASLIGKVLPVVVVLGLLGTAWYAVHQMSTDTGAPLPGVEGAAAGGQAASILHLPAGKLEAGNFQSAPVQRRWIQHMHVVPGRIRYNEAKHIELKTPIGGILSELLVKPGDVVEAGELVAVVTSPEIGRARAEVLKRQAELELVQRRFDRQSEIAANLQELLSQIDSGADSAVLDKLLADRPLGNFRQMVEPAYAKFRLAQQLAENIRPLADTGSVAGRTMKEREAELQIARAEYRSARDQASFAAAQAKREAEAELADAERLLKIARQQLESLLGYTEQEVSMDSKQSLSRLELRAPFKATVESRGLAENERVEASDAILVLADTSSLYIAADIRENDWPAVTLETGTQVKVTAPALPERTFTATVHYVGREVIAETNAVRLVATIDNPDGILRPGMFVRVALPVGPPHEALAVPPEAILRQENEEFVFVELGEGTFQKVDIRTGAVSDEWLEVKQGLSEGQRVVGTGAFLLKSEFLLEGEVE